MEVWSAAFLMLSVCVVAWGAVELTRPKSLEGARAKVRLTAFVTSLIATVLGLFFDLWREDRAAKALHQRLEFMKPTLPAPALPFLSDDRMPKPFQMPPNPQRRDIPKDTFGRPPPAK